MTKEQRAKLEHCTVSCMNKKVKYKVKGASKRYLLGTIDDVVSVICGEYNHLIQHIKLDSRIARKWQCQYAFRTGYYTLTAKTRKIVWGQYHSSVPEGVYRELARKANEKGWLGLSKA